MSIYTDHLQKLFTPPNVLNVWQWAEPVKALIDQMPRSVAIRCNVTDTATAEAALREWVLKELYPMMARKM